LVDAGRKKNAGESRRRKDRRDLGTARLVAYSMKPRSQLKVLAAVLAKELDDG